MSDIQGLGALQTILIRDIKHPRLMLISDTETTVEEAIKLMSEHKILSTPVFEPKKHQIIGIVDMLDIAAWVLGLLETETDPAAIATKFRETLVSSIIDKSETDPTCPVFDGAPLFQLIEVFATGVHRVPVYSDDPKLVINVVSQSDIIRFLAERPEILDPELAERTLDQIAFEDTEMNFGRTSPVTIDTNAPTEQAYRLMVDWHVSSVGVVDEKGDLVTSINPSSLRFLTPETTLDLKLPVLEFLKKHDPEGVSEPIMITPQAKLGEILRLIASASRSARRLWVVDENGTSKKPIGVISNTDIMNVLSYFGAP